MSTQDPSPTPTISPEELRSRVIYSLCGGAVILARRFAVPLKELTSWLQLAYFQELRRHGLTLKEAGVAMGVGMRKAAELSQRMKSNFFGPEREHELPRRVEFMLWAEPLSRARILQLLRAEPADEVDAAIERLLAENRIEVVRGRSDVYTVTSGRARLVKPTWMSQIDGINNLIKNVAGAAHERVFRHSSRALLRTLSFRLAPEDVSELQKLYETVIFPALAALEEKATGREDALTMDFSILWCPEDASSRVDDPEVIE